VREPVLAPDERRPGPETAAPDERVKVHRVETKTKTPPEARRQGPTLEAVRRDDRVRTFIRSANQQTGAIGYTEHGERHANTTADGARFILRSLGHEARRCELAAVAAYLHDIGNVITREKHGQTGALLIQPILLDLGFTLEEVAIVMGAIANHEESEGGLPVSAVSAAVIIADKSDVHRSRVRNPKTTTFDIHDRVNYAATSSEIKVSRKEKLITLELTIDTEVAPLMEYFEIFLSRMMLSRRAAEFLRCNFALLINGVRLL
jgi:metal-dependent HD superfamily phosphatase/phosphodiesterase